MLARRFRDSLAKPVSSSIPRSWDSAAAQAFLGGRPRAMPAVIRRLAVGTKKDPPPQAGSRIEGSLVLSTKGAAACIAAAVRAGGVKYAESCLRLSASIR